MPTALFAWRRTPPPLLIGGAEVTQQLLAEELAASGWQVTYLGSHEAPWNGSSQTSALRALLDARGAPYEDLDGVTRYRWNEVDCIAVPQHQIAAALDSLQTLLHPDVVFTSQEGAADIARQARAGALVAGILHSVSKTGLGVLEGRPHHALAVSEFALRQAPQHPGTRLAVLYPPFTASLPEPEVPRTEAVLMVNPIPAKGSALLHGLIRLMPGQPFTLVEGWWNNEAEFAGYPNVTYVPRTYDMGRLYRSHRVLLVPSVVEDAYPRVIIEAALHGTSCIGADRGGIPEAIGAAGVLLPHNAGTAAWAEAIRTMNHRVLGEEARGQAAALAGPCLPRLRELGIYPAVNAPST